jgi:hypothetical protein
VLRKKLEKYALTKPLPPYKGTIKDGKTSDAEGRRNQSTRRKEDGEQLISRLSKARKLSRAV